MFASINGRDVTEQIRSPDVTANAKYIASSEKIRQRLVQMQRDFAAGQEKVVTEGRDQGTVAFPDADIKFFLTADLAANVPKEDRQNCSQKASMNQSNQSKRPSMKETKATATERSAL